MRSWLLLSCSLAALPAQAQDRDGDGLSDEDETSGVAGQPLLDLPAYGVDPDRKDLLIQADWFGCDPQVDFCGPENSFDRNQLSARYARELAAYYAPDVVLHIDNGVPAPAGETTYGDWGGAHRVTTTTPCSEALGERFGWFHHGNFSQLGSGGGADMYGFCFGADSVFMGVAAQELGHNLGLQHGGSTPSYPANCKPNYRSPMNYAFTGDLALHQLSRGQMIDTPLSPPAMDERRGLGTTDPEVPDAMRHLPWDYLVDEQGGIDWDRDGVIEDGLVRAAPTWAWASCEQSVAHTDSFAGHGDAAMAWLPDRMLLVLRDPMGNLVFHSATRFDQCEPSNEPEHCVDWMPASDQPGTAIPGAPVGPDAPAAVAFAGKILVIAGDAGGILSRLIYDGSSWSVAALPDGMVEGDPAVVVHGPEALVLAPQAGTLMRWSVDLASGTPSALGPATWDDDTPIASCAGAGLTLATLAGDSAPTVIAAIPTGWPCTVRMARLGDDGRFVPLDDVWQTTAPVTGGRVSLAYVAPPLAPDDGRFYLTWRPLPSGAGLISLSEGNDLRPGASDHRFWFKRGTYVRNLWALQSGGVTLAYDPAHDQNLRAATALFVRAADLQFHPFADGILPVTMRDQDDYADIPRYLACSLTSSCGGQ